MALIEDLVNRIDDIELRQRIKTEVDKLSKRKKFGLVFEEHLPEFTSLYDVDIKVGNTVALKDSKATETYTVQSIENHVVTVINRVTKEASSYPIEQLVVVAEFGEPVYPYLEKLDSIENAPGDGLWHILIESDNYHALQLLNYLYAGKLDCIYIDPPYNNRSKEWKYNNDYVDVTNSFKHSKWLSMMEKRLKLAKKLLNPSTGVMIVTIDENEVHHLGMLLEEILPEAYIQMVTIVINPKGSTRHRFSRVEEYAFFCFMPNATVSSGNDPMLGEISKSSGNKPRWKGLLRSGADAQREDSPNLFYPILIDKETNTIVRAEAAVPLGVEVDYDQTIDGYDVAYPIRSDMSEGRWMLATDTFNSMLEKGYISLGRYDKVRNTWGMSYLSKKFQTMIDTGDITIIGKSPNGQSVDVEFVDQQAKQVKTVWHRTKHDAGAYGSDMLSSIFKRTRKFDFPKSLYSVTDAIQMVVRNNKNAIVLDFFAGSGTTGHAVKLLNSLDGGNRQSILVTNNEVSNVEANELMTNGYHPGDKEWDSLGIARHITWPRLTSAITGNDVEGNTIGDTYIVDSDKTKLVPRYFKKIDFTNSSELNTASKKKGLLSLIDSNKNDLTQSMIKGDTEYIVSDNHNTSILFNLDYKDEWLDSLEDMNHIFNFYIVADTPNFNTIQKEVKELLGSYEEFGEVRIPMSEGLKANAVFFKLGFLNKDSVALGRQFKELLSVLWMKAGAIGECPGLDDSELPEYLFFPDNNFAVLLNETHYASFKDELDSDSEFKTVFIVTNSEKGFTEMSSGLGVAKTYQLYRDYLDNFRINVRRT
jgi:adenine-specific DNA-methyltransferase